MHFPSHSPITHEVFPDVGDVGAGFKRHGWVDIPRILATCTQVDQCQENISATFVQVVHLIQTCSPVVASILLTRPVSPAQRGEVLLVKGK